MALLYSKSPRASLGTQEKEPRCSVWASESSGSSHLALCFTSSQTVLLILRSVQPLCLQVSSQKCCENTPLAHTCMHTHTNRPFSHKHTCTNAHWDLHTHKHKHMNTHRNALLTDSLDTLFFSFLRHSWPYLVITLRVTSSQQCSPLPSSALVALLCSY